jgi:hypothetical protein
MCERLDWHIMFGPGENNPPQYVLVQQEVLGIPIDRAPDAKPAKLVVKGVRNVRAVAEKMNCLKVTGRGPLVIKKGDPRQRLKYLAQGVDPRRMPYVPDLCSKCTYASCCLILFKYQREVRKAQKNW